MRRIKILTKKNKAILYKKLTDYLKRERNNIIPYKEV